MPSETPSADTLSTALAEVVRARGDVAAAYLYGSMARERTTSLSDLDVGLLFTEAAGVVEERLRVVSEVASELSRRIPELPLDVRDVDDLPLAVVGPLLLDGRLVASNDDVRRVSFERDMRRRYFDFLPVHRREVEEGLGGLRRRFGRG